MPLTPLALLLADPDARHSPADILRTDYSMRNITTQLSVSRFQQPSPFWKQRGVSAPNNTGIALHSSSTNHTQDSRSVGCTSDRAQSHRTAAVTKQRRWVDSTRHFDPRQVFRCIPCSLFQSFGVGTIPARLVWVYGRSGLRQLARCYPCSRLASI